MLSGRPSRSLGPGNSSRKKSASPASKDRKPFGTILIADGSEAGGVVGVGTEGGLQVGLKTYDKTIPLADHEVILTFDDGPDAESTSKVLDALAEECVRATFFLIGRKVEDLPELVRRELAEGHTLAHHTFTHPQLIFKSAAQTRQQLLDCRKALQDAIGEHSNLFRPPYGGRRPSTLRVARELGLETVMWNVTGYDWNAPPASVIEKKVVRQMQGGDIILLHDGDDKVMGADRGQTVIATENLIRRYKDQGYEFVTVDEMPALSRPLSAVS